MFNELWNLIQEKAESRNLSLENYCIFKCEHCFKLQQWQVQMFK